MRIAFKYCGGCNPRYDRLALAEEIKRRLGRTARFVAMDEARVDLVLAIEGCETACADLSAFQGRPVRIITRPEDLPDILRVLSLHH